MKSLRAILACLFMLFSSAAYADDIVISKTLSDAKTLAAKENKQVMLIFTQDGCPMCEYLKEVLFKNADVISVVNARFVVTEMDIHKDKAPDGFKAYGTPTIYFMTPAGVKIGRPIVGAAKPDVFVGMLKAVPR